MKEKPKGTCPEALWFGSDCDYQGDERGLQAHYKEAHPAIYADLLRKLPNLKEKP